MLLRPRHIQKLISELAGYLLAGVYSHDVMCIRAVDQASLGVRFHSLLIAFVVVLNAFIMLYSVVLGFAVEKLSNVRLHPFHLILFIFWSFVKFFLNVSNHLSS